MKFIDEVEIRMKQFYTTKNCRGMSTIYTPKEVRDKMTVHAKPEMKILVMFNFEFCYDLWKMGCKDVMFVSDDELRNKIVEETWGFKTELIDPRSINKKITGMKLDLIIGNPPYNSGLDLKILESVIDLSDNVCFVHPVGWLLRKGEVGKNNTDFRKKSFIQRLSKIEMIDGNSIFGINLFMPCAITFFKKEKSENIQIIDASCHFHYDIKIWNENDVFKIDKYGWYKNYLSIKEKISNTQKLKLEDWREKEIPSISLGVASIRGNVASNDFYTIVQKDYNKHRNHSYKFGWSFSSEEETKNCYDYLKTKFARFCLSIYKFDANIIFFLHYIPLFDFTKSWTDKECAAELGISDEELTWMQSVIPDYYSEDFQNL